LQETILTWARMLGCPLEPKIFRDQDGDKAVSYAPCKENSEIGFYTIEVMGHTREGKVFGRSAWWARRRTRSTRTMSSENSSRNILRPEAKGGLLAPVQNPSPTPRLRGLT